jgi:predicted anti-sigma-YlaC factor YlaD
MRKSNCKRMIRAMSLYVAGDLVGRAEREATAHIAECQTCRQLAAQFSESSSLLTQACALPEFETDFYARIRSTVLGQIAVYATSLAAVIVAAVALQFFRGVPHQTSPGPGVKAQLIGLATQGDTKSSPASSPRPLSASRSDSQTGRSRQALAAMQSRSRSPQIQAGRNPAALEASARSIRKEIAPAIPYVDPVSVNLPGQPALSPARPTSLAEAEVSRIEIQTADPNIRIIWLTRREPHKSEETNRDPGPETGDRN